MPLLSLSTIWSQGIKPEISQPYHKDDKRSNLMGLCDAWHVICITFQAMLEDKMRETDWEVTQDTIEEQVARESYLQWLRDNEKRAKRQASVSSPIYNFRVFMELFDCLSW